MNNDDFRKHAHEMVDWMADYLSEVESYPVKSQLKPGDVISALPVEAPDKSESVENIISDVSSQFKLIVRYLFPRFIDYI